MNKTIASLCALILAFAAPLSASAEEWNTMGPRAMGMGGAGVALAQGPLASYWNPAALGRPTENAYGFQLPASIHVAVTGTALEGAKDFQNVTTACSAKNLTACTQANITNALNELNNPNNGFRVDGSVGGDFKIGKIALFANGFVAAGAVPQVDNVNVSTTSGSTFVGHNNSALILKGAQIAEIGAGYGHELPWVPGLFVGGDLKLMRANVGYTRYSLNNSNASESDFLTSYKNNSAVSANIGVDAGALWDVNKTYDSVWWAPRVGLTGRNLNNPKFSQPGSASANGVGGLYAVNPQARLGVAISPFHFWNIAADLDLTRNLTPVDGVASRQLDIGTEVNIFNRSWINIPLRFGVAHNLAEQGSGTMLTAGAGINLLHLIIDFAGEASPQRIQTQSQGSSTKIPQEFGASVQISLLFGGSEGKAAKKKKAEDETPVNDLKPDAPAKAAPAKASNDLPPAQTDQIKANAAQSQKELDQTKPAPAGK